MKALNPVRGTHDLFGDPMLRFQHVVACFATIASRFCFQPVATPIFEVTEVFARSLGESTDVVSKEMYSFADKSGDSLTLRPEYTAGIARAYISNGWQQWAPLKLYAHGPMFRYERPQKGRFRQFHQIDAEILGAAEPQADAEIIALAAVVLEALGLSDRVVLNLNTLGDGPSREAYRAALVAYFDAHRADLSRESLERLSRNPLRILDSKDPSDQALVAEAPLIDAYLTPTAEQFFTQLTALLDTMEIAYVRNPRLVRGLDYYAHTAFEFVTHHLGAQGTVIGGGRYDGLMEHLGGPPTPCVGFAGGIERLAMLIEVPPAGTTPPIVVVPLGEAAGAACVKITTDLRRQGFVVEQAFRGSVKKRMSKAAESGARAVLILGETELAAGTIVLKDLTSGTQEHIPLALLVSALQKYV